jgi:hypothetical protein
MWPMVLSIVSAAAVQTLERVARVAAVTVGVVLLMLTVMGPRTWWGGLGIVPLAMGLSGW